MRLRHIAAAASAVGALAAAPATAMEVAVKGPGCAARLLAAGAATSSSCSFGQTLASVNTRYSTISVVTDRVVTATVSCYYNGYTYASSRTVYDQAGWTAYTPGTSCSLRLTAGEYGATAVATATPNLGPIIAEPHYPVP